jgi:hypothetical protein
MTAGRRSNGQFAKGFGGKRHHLYKHGHNRAGRMTREYRTWSQIWQRTTWPKNPAWNRYGGSRVQISPRWRGRHGFENFLKDLGRRPRATSWAVYSIWATTRRATANGRQSASRQRSTWGRPPQRRGMNADPCDLRHSATGAGRSVESENEKRFRRCKKRGGKNHEH